MGQCDNEPEKPESIEAGYFRTVVQMRKCKKFLVNHCAMEARKTYADMDDDERARKLFQISEVTSGGKNTTTKYTRFIGDHLACEGGGFSCFAGAHRSGGRTARKPALSAKK